MELKKSGAEKIPLQAALEHPLRGALNLSIVFTRLVVLFWFEQDSLIITYTT